MPDPAAVHSQRAGARARTTRRVAALIVIAAIAAGCGSSTHPSSATAGHGTTRESAVPITPAGQPRGSLATPGTPKGEETVSIQVVATKGTTKRSAMALVPVYINGHGPLPFALDTGASRSLIALALAQKLGLPDRGSAGTLYGVAGSAKAENVQVSNWRAGNVKLPTEIVAAMSSSQGGSKTPPQGSSAVTGPVGLLGSDVLSRYGKIAIDYDKGLLILDPPVK